MHEEDYSILWKHTDWRTEETEVRRSRGLVVSFVLVSALGIQLAAMFLYAICAGITWYCVYKDIQLSTISMLAIKGLSVGLILLLAVVVLFRQNFAVEMSHLSLQKLKPEGLQLGLVLAIFSYVKFESSTALGDKAKKPLQFTPRAVILSTGTIKLVFYPAFLR